MVSATEFTSYRIRCNIDNFFIHHPVFQVDYLSVCCRFGLLVIIIIIIIITVVVVCRRRRNKERAVTIVGAGSMELDHSDTRHSDLSAAEAENNLNMHHLQGNAIPPGHVLNPLSDSLLNLA